MVDVLCFDDLDVMGRDLDDPLEELAQDLYHRLIERPGGNIDDPDRGVGIVQMLSGTLDPSIARLVDADFEKDDRVSASHTTITRTAAGEYRIDIEVDANGETLGLVFESDGTTLRRVT